jgi:hypothetical protein
MSVPARLRREVTRRAGNRCEYRALTATGRATISLLKMNRALAVAIRAEERVHLRHPPN